MGKISIPYLQIPPVSFEMHYEENENKEENNN